MVADSAPIGFAYIESTNGEILSAKNISSALTLERIWLGLRTNRGIALDCMKGDLAPLAQSWEDAGWAERLDGTLRLTPEGWLVMDRLTLELEARQAGEIGGNECSGEPGN